MTEGVPATEQQPVVTAAGTERNVVGVIGRGNDGPGIADAFLKVAVDNSCQVLDMVQFLMEGTLVFTFVLELNKSSSVKVLQEMLDTGKSRGLKMDLHFQHQQEADVASMNAASISIVSPNTITPSLLHGLDSILAQLGCVCHEIEHRSDNKAENNGECNKLQLRVSCPPGLKLTTLYTGGPQAQALCAGGLQKVAAAHGAVVTVRWWDAMSRPNGKSLVVFELSSVLCPYDVLDEMLKEAGVDPAVAVTASDGAECHAEGDGGEQQPGKSLGEVKAKVGLLQGQSTSIVRKVLERLQLTPGARLVCGALKAMGFRLAILTRTGCREVAEHVRLQLGIDYVMAQELESKDGMFTGALGGEASGVRFRKSDLLKLMADREGISYRNVISVGEGFLRGLTDSEMRLVLDTFGPNVSFDSERLGDLALVLYLLGFNGSHVREMRQVFEPCAAQARGEAVASPALGPQPPRGAVRLIAQINAQSRDPGQMQKIFGSLMAFQSEVAVSTVRQCSLQDGGMCLGLELSTQNPERTEAAQVAKELLFACNQAGFQVEVSMQDVSTCPKIPRNCWQHYGGSRYVITLVQQPKIAATTLKTLFGALAAKGVNTLKIERLSVQELSAMQLVVKLPDGMAAEELSGSLLQVSKERGADIAIQRDDVDRWMRRLIVFDMDSTLIQQEVIDELAALAGVGDQVKTITEAAMRGELNFFESLKARVALLKGHNAEELFAKVKENLIFTPGAKRLCSTLKKMGYKMAVISGGFLPVAQEVQRHLGLDYAFANTLEVDEQTGLLTGSTSGPVVTPQRKRALLATIANVEGCKVQQTVAVGDGSNDIPMLNAAGLGIAFCAKPKVQAAAEYRINQKDLSTVLFLIGLSEHATERVAPPVDELPTKRLRTQ